MSNWFASIGTAASGINAARYGLDVTTQNITNADTDGYVQRRADQVSVDGGPIANLYSTNSATSLYGGTRIATVSRVTDPILDARVRDEHSRGSLSSTNASIMSDIENVLPEPGDDGVAGRLDDFWKSWGSLANSPENAGTRTAVLSSARSVALALNTAARSLDGVTATTSANLSADVDAARAAAGQLADLNGKIAIASATGTDANGLLDRRDQLLDSLSKLVGGVATINANGSANVTVGGQALVTGTTSASITVDANYSVQVGGTAVTLTGGSAAGRYAALTTSIPAYRAKLDAVADAVVAAGNQIQASGRDSSGATGAAMFSGSGAAGIAVVLTDPAKLAAASATGGALDGSNALAASQRGTSSAGPDALYSALVGAVAADTATAAQVRDTQATVVSSVDSLRASITGVSFDEEMSKMLTYQRAFQASSRALTTIDSLLDTLINRMGAGA